MSRPPHCNWRSMPSLMLQRPLLIKGEPGTGKTMLAEEIAQSLGMAMIAWHIKSTTKAQQGLYEYDAVSRLRDSQLGNERVNDISALHQARESCGQAFQSEHPVVLLIDEIDKGGISSFPTTCCWNSTGWNSSSTRQVKPSGPDIDRLS